MKLIFTKSDDHQVTVCQETDGLEETFSYVNMIRVLLDEGALEPSELKGDFTDPEQKSINRMVALINKAIESEAENVEKNELEVGEDVHDGEENLNG